MRLSFEVDFQVEEIVYYKTNPETAYMVVGYKVLEGVVQYLVANAEFGILEAFSRELTTERSVF